MRQLAEFIDLSSDELRARVAAMKTELDARQRDSLAEMHIPETSKRMLEAIRQLIADRKGGFSVGHWTLGEFSDEQLLTIARYIRGFRE